MDQNINKKVNKSKWNGSDLMFCEKCEMWFRKDNKWCHRNSMSHKLKSAISPEMIKMIFK